MKPSIASFLSISAIVVAGGAALAVNATVFEAPPTASATEAPEVLVVPAAAAIEQVAGGESIVGELGTLDAAASDLTVPTTIVANGQASVSALSEYDIPGVGVVTVSQTGNTIAITGVTTATGYTYSMSEPFPGRLDVKFTSSSKEIEFDAQLIDGRIVTSVRSKAVGVVAAAPAATKQHHDNDDDEDEHEENEEHEEHDEEDDD